MHDTRPHYSIRSTSAMHNTFVRKLSSYAALSDEEVFLLTKACSSVRRMSALHDMAREGENSDAVLILLEGWACRYKVMKDGSRQILALMLPGDTTDVHAGPLDEADYNVGTLTDCLISVLSHTDMQQLISSTPTLTRLFWHAHHVETAIQRAWIANIGRRNAQTRLSHLFLEIFARMACVGLLKGSSCALPLTQSVLGDALGLTAIHVNRMLRIMRDDDVLSTGSGMLTIRDPAALANAVGYDARYLRPKLAV